MSLHKLRGWVIVEYDGSGEDAAASFNQGFEGAVAHWPDGQVLEADIESVDPVGDDEAQERGLVE